VFASEDPGVRMDYRDGSPDGRRVVFGRVSPGGGEVRMLEGLE